MSFASPFGRLLSTWWLPWTSAAFISFAVLVHFERRYADLAAKYQQELIDSKGNSEKEITPVQVLECASTLAGVDVKTAEVDGGQNIPHECTTTVSSDPQNSSTPQFEAIATDASEVPVTTHPTHFSVVPTATKQKRRSTVADIVTTALSKGSSVTINPPSNPASLTCSFTVSPCKPCPFGNAVLPTIGILPSPVDSPGQFPWTEQPDTNQARSGSPIKPKFDFSSMSAKSVKPAAKLPTIDEEAGSSAEVIFSPGFGCAG